MLDRKDNLYLYLAMRLFLRAVCKSGPQQEENWTKGVFKESLKRELFTNVWTGLWEEEIVKHLEINNRGQQLLPKA